MIGKIFKNRFERARKKSPILKENANKKRATKAMDIIPELYLELSNIKPIGRVCMNVIEEEDSHNHDDDHDNHDHHASPQKKGVKHFHQFLIGN